MSDKRPPFSKKCLLHRTGYPLIGTLGLGLVLILTPLAHTWEVDVHYGLTLWLAQQAGFSAHAARLIAEGNQSMDVGALSPVTLVFWYGCLKSDTGASRLMQARHFPSSGLIPRDPQHRRVEPANLAATQGAESYIQTRPSSQDEKETSLTKFGEALHPLQDSWSHQGVPSIPFACHNNLASAHPENRGGWDSHKADHTHEYVQDAMDAGKVTYEYLVRYLKSHTWAGVKEKEPIDWNALEHEVSRFATAKTKSEKKAWFIRNNLPTSFLNEITLEDGKEYFSVAALMLRGQQQTDAIPKIVNVKYKPPQLREDIFEFLDQFFELLVTGENDEDLMEYFINEKRVAQSMRLPTEEYTDLTFPILTALRMWRMRDHGLVSKLGHASMGVGRKQMLELGNAIANKNALLKFGSMNEGLLPLQSGPYKVFRLTKATDLSSPKEDMFAGDAAAIFQFKHTPMDVVLVVLEYNKKNQLRVVSLLWSAAH